MLTSAAITAHSPILLNTADEQISRFRKDTFAPIASLIKSKGIRHVISLSAHPAFARQGFSAYVERELELQFPEFGDLVTHEFLQPGWRLYHYLRERALPIEPLNAGRLDYGHGIPLLMLRKELEKHEIDVLCINDDPKAADQQQFAFGKQLGDLIHDFEEPVFVLCSGDLCLPEQKKQAGICQAFNREYMDYIKRSFEPANEPQAVPPELISPCLHGPLQILRGMVSKAEGLTYEDLSRAESSPVSLFSALLCTRTSSR
jgi:hypothetical protein